MPQQFGRRVGGVGIEGDHGAARVALDNHQLQMVADFQGFADQGLLEESVVLIIPFRIKIGPEAPLVDVHAQFLAELGGRRQRDKRHRSGVELTPLGHVNPQRPAGDFFQVGDEGRVLNVVVGLAVRGLDADREVIGIGIDRVDARSPLAIGGVEISGQQQAVARLVAGRV